MNFFRNILVLLLFVLAIPIVHGEEERGEGYYSLINEQGEVICRTGHKTHVGDEYLTADDHLYRVERVEGDIARVRFVKNRTKGEVGANSLWDNWFFALKGILIGQKRVQTDGARPIAIYHTHTDESYVPTDGKSSIEGKGGIFQVGEALTQRLRKDGVKVVHNKTPHDPHDAMAYDRSRRTAVELLKKRPVALIDVHRDAVPAEEYADNINNTEVTKIQLVVGRQNPNRSASEGFARQIKDTVNKKHPGMVKGIFFGKGKYNQDLAPRLILVEVGSHTNSREAAERGAVIFASAAQEVLYNRGRGAQGGRVQKGAFKSLYWILGLAVFGVVVYLLLNSGALNKLGKNAKEEFAGALGSKEMEEDTPESSYDGKE
jgi:stage II sporulation protein P